VGGWLLTSIIWAHAAWFNLAAYASLVYRVSSSNKTTGKVSTLIAAYLFLFGRELLSRRGCMVQVILKPHLTRTALFGVRTICASLTFGNWLMYGFFSSTPAAGQRDVMFRWFGPFSNAGIAADRRFHIA